MPNTSRQALLPAPKQLHLQNNQPPDIIEVLTGIINTYSKNGSQQQRGEYQQPQQQQQQPQYSSRGKGPANGKGFLRAYLKTDTKEKSYLQKKQTESYTNH